MSNENFKPFYAKAIDPCVMTSGIDLGKAMLTVGKQYLVFKETEESFFIINDLNENHSFGKDNFHNFFKVDLEQSTDRIIENVVNKIRSRSRIGIQKYGTTLDENNTDNFLKHLQEELFDASNYIEKLLIQAEQVKTENLNITDKVLIWADKRDLLTNGNPFKQFTKLQEESNELLTAMLDSNEDEIMDAIGDIGVVMIILANQLGYNFFECIEKAYDVIKNRTGKTVNGTFVKD